MAGQTCNIRNSSIIGCMDSFLTFRRNNKQVFADIGTTSSSSHVKYGKAEVWYYLDSESNVARSVPSISSPSRSSKSVHLHTEQPCSTNQYKVCFLFSANLTAEYTYTMFQWTTKTYYISITRFCKSTKFLSPETVINLVVRRTADRALVTFDGRMNR